MQRALGEVMVLTAVAMAFDADVRFQTAIARLTSRLANESNTSRSWLI